jgi:hypothetical protein
MVILLLLLRTKTHPYLPVQTPAGLVRRFFLVDGSLATPAGEPQDGSSSMAVVFAAQLTLTVTNRADTRNRIMPPLITLRCAGIVPGRGKRCSSAYDPAVRNKGWVRQTAVFWTYAQRLDVTSSVTNHHGVSADCCCIASLPLSPPRPPMPPPSVRYAALRGTRGASAGQGRLMIGSISSSSGGGGSVGGAGPSLPALFSVEYLNAPEVVAAFWVSWRAALIVLLLLLGGPVWAWRVLLSVRRRPASAPPGLELLLAAALAAADALSAVLAAVLASVRLLRLWGV